MKKTLYRIQGSNGRGPFAPGFSKWWIENRADHKVLLPWFMEFNDFFPTLIGHEVAFGVACKTIEQLKRWFTKSEYRKLLKFGYHAVQIDYSRILAASDVQCVFARTKPLNKDVCVFELYKIERFENK